MPDVQKQFMVTDDPVQLILEKAKQADVIVLGTTIQPVTSSVSLGPFADHILKEASLRRDRGQKRKTFAASGL